MRTIFVAAILLLGISSAWPDPQPAASGGSLFSSAADTGSAIAAGNRKPVAAVPPVQTLEPSPPAAAASAPAGAPAPSGQAAPTPKAGTAPTPTPAQAQNTPPHSLDEVCNTLFASAQLNELPVAFFANLIWQESRLRNNAVSPKGAMGIAQFMPQVAAKSGLDNPFDPLQALPASAKLLRDLFDQFGNLGYVAAAYNAGTQRVMDWLEHGRSLPRETRGYVMNITGRSVEAWRKTPAEDSALRFARRLPCRGLPAFAELEQQQVKQAELARKQAEQARAEQAQLARKQAEAARAQAAAQKTASQEVRTQQKTASHRKTASAQKASRQKTASRQAPARRRQKVATAPTAKDKRAHLAKDERSHKAVGREAVRPAKRERPREAKEHIRHTPHERHRPA